MGRVRQRSRSLFSKILQGVKMYKLKEYFRRFKRKEDGAVTVDWVVLTAGVVGLAAGTLASSSNVFVSFASDVATFMGGLR